MNIFNKIFYRIKNLLFLLFLYGNIKLIPKLNSVGTIGKIYLIMVVIYTLFIAYAYFKKSDQLNSNITNNIISMVLYIYVYLISTRVLNIQMLHYFNVNYIIVFILMIQIFINSILLINNKNKNVF